MDTGKPTILFSITRKNIGDIHHKNIIAYNTNNTGPEGKIFIDADLKYDDLKILIDNNDGIISHITNTTLHWSVADRRYYLEQMSKLDGHVDDRVIHVTQDDRNNWDAKETEAGAQIKANAVLTELTIHMADADVHVTKKEKERLSNTYTKSEIANMISSSQLNTDWKPAVNNFEDLAIEYPDPKKGWICTVLNTADPTKGSVTYSYNGEEWVLAFIDYMPLATPDVDGRMSKDYAKKLENIEANANYYIHPDTVNIRHVTDMQISKWDDKASKKLATIFESGLMSALDKEKMDTIEKYANYYILPDKLDPSIIDQNEYNRFVTDVQIKKWDNPAGVMASDTQDGAMSKEMYVKLDNIEEFANHYVHPIKHSSTDIAEDKDHRWVTDGQISKWDGKEDPGVSQSRADSALQLANEYTDAKIDDLVGSTPGMLDSLKELADALGNDPNFSTTIMTMLSNKADLNDFKDHVNDTSGHLSSVDRVKFNGIEENANHYVLPTTLPATIIEQTTGYRFVSDTQINSWDSKANGTLATPKNDGQMSKEYASKLESITTLGMLKSNWAETDPDSGSFIDNKPTALPAIGGDSDTVKGYTPNDLMDGKKSSTVIVGCSTSINMKDKHPDFFCDGTNDVLMIKHALDAVAGTGGELIFREGEYNITETIDISGVGITIRGMGATNTVFKCGSPTMTEMIVLSGQSITLSDMTLSTNSVSCNIIHLKNNFNTVKNCSFVGHSSLYVSGGSYSTIQDNYLGSTNIVVNSKDEDTVGLRIVNNTILAVEGTKAGIALESTNNHKVRNCIVSNNMITDCYSGIVLSNDAGSHEYTINNTINSNSIMRNLGDVKDYLYEQHTIRVLHGGFNIATGNMCRGRTPVDNGIDNMLINNIAVSDGTLT